MSTFREMKRIAGGGRTRRPIIVEFNAKLVFTVLGLVCLGWACVFWYKIQIVLYPGQLLPALAIASLLAFGSPALLCWLIPWTAGGMLYQRTTAKTWGFLAVAAFALYYLYYCATLIYSWNLAQPVVVDSGLELRNTIVQLIGFVGIPALVF